MAKKNLIIVELLSLSMIAVGGCAHKAVKPDKPVSSPAAPAEDTSAEDEKRFQEVMDMLYKLKGESPPAAGAEAAPAAAKPAATAAEKTASSPAPQSTPPAAADTASQAKTEQQKAAVPLGAAATAAVVTPAPVSAPIEAKPAKVAKSPELALPAPLAETPAASALSPQDIKDTIKKLTTHPRVRYLSASGEYSYYVGGQIDARYDINNKKLTVTNDGQSGNDTVQCQYSDDGRMISDGTPIPPRKTAACNALIRELLDMLAH